MRWGEKDPAVGSERNRQVFLYFPKTINGITRWLEFATMREVYRRTSGVSSFSNNAYEWAPVEWND